LKTPKLLKSILKSPKKSKSIEIIPSFKVDGDEDSSNNNNSKFDKIS